MVWGELWGHWLFGDYASPTLSVNILSIYFRLQCDLGDLGSLTLRHFAQLRSVLGVKVYVANTTIFCPNKFIAQVISSPSRLRECAVTYFVSVWWLFPFE